MIASSPRGQWVNDPSVRVLTYSCCYVADNQYMLKMRFVDHIYDDQVIDSMTVKIILPEGAKWVLQGYQLTS